MEYWVEIIKALAWPTSTIWLGYIFKNEIRLLLSRMSKFKYKEMEANFENNLATAENSAKKLPSLGRAQFHHSISQEEQLFRIAEISPKAAIIEAWTLIESAAVKAGLSSGTVIQRVSTRSIIDHLVESEKLSPESIKLIEQLRKIRNQAAHLSESDFAITQDEAERYLSLATQCSTIIMNEREPSTGASEI